MLAEELFGAGEVVGGIDADGLDVCFGHTDAIAVLQLTKLLEALGHLE